MIVPAHTDQLLPGGLMGYLDVCEYKKSGDGDLVSVRGWVFSSGARVQSVLVKRKKGPRVAVHYGLPRPDVAKAYPEDRQAETAGFAGTATIPGWSERSAAKIEICALLENGEEICCFSRDFSPPGVGRSQKVGFATFIGASARRAVAAYLDGRLSFAPRKWLRDLRLHYRLMHPEQIAAAPSPATAVPDTKQELAGLYTAILQSFLDSRSRLYWPRHDSPRVSIVLVLSNGAEFTLRCLHALQNFALPVEIILVDNASTDDTRQLLTRLDGVEIVRQSENIGFVRACNEGARRAAGKHLLFLNSNVELLPGSLESAVRTLENTDNIGAVGAKIVLPSGRLKEAGGMIWRDGTYEGYGRGDIPRAPVYMFRRDVDYCSQSFLLTGRHLFLSMGSFDDAYDPEYYQDIDYCVRLIKSGKRVVFDPGTVAVQFERPDSIVAEDGIRLQKEHLELFRERHADWIAHKRLPHDRRLLEARSIPHTGQRVLVLDDRVPHFRHGAGFPRAVELIRALDESGCFVTFYPVTMPQEDWSEVYDDIPRTVEVIVGWGAERLEEFLKEREGFYQQIIVSRPHNMETFRSKFRKDGRWNTNARVIYDAEAVFSFREAEQRRLAGADVSGEQVAQLFAEEMNLAEGVHAVFSVTDRERDYFLSSGVRTAWTLAHTVAVNPTPRRFGERAGFLFVGALGGIPNRDAVLWFVRDIWPQIRSLVGDKVSFNVAGAQPPDEIRAMPDVNVLGAVSDLTHLYDCSRIFVAPSRLAAGIPIKIQTAAAHGLPVVGTSILAGELGWHHEVELLVADSPEEFAKCCARLYSDGELWQSLRSRALERVTRECSREAFAAILARALS